MPSDDFLPGAEAPSGESSTGARTSARQRRHVTDQPRHQVRRGTAVALCGLLTFVGAGAVFAYQDVRSNLATHDLDDILGGPERERPSGASAPDDPLDGRAYNVMVIGSDAREEGSDIGGMRSDTNLLVHVSADRSRVDVVSIPRDLLVDIPSCPLPGGEHTRPLSAGSGDSGTRFNAAFATGGQTGDVAHGAACTVLTTEAMTGVFIDDFVVVDFDGFTDVIDALGGVEMCFEEAIDAPKAHLEIEAGCHTLDGETALGVARARVGVDDGSDISRIGRQQELLTAITDEALDANLITNPPAMLRFLRATASAMTTSDRMGDLSAMTAMAYSLRGLDTADVTFATVPFDWSGNVVVQNADGAALWESIRADEPMVLPGDEPETTDPDAPDSGQDGAAGETDSGAGGA